MPITRYQICDLKYWLPASLGLFLTCWMPNKAVGWQMKQGPLMTRWTSQIETNAPLPEYPRPQMVRTNWLNLNGVWQFQAGATNDPVPSGQTLSSEILVPYPMESAISGVMAYHEFSWYRRTFTVPPSWGGKQIILHLDAVNWASQVYLNGQSLGIHKGGYDPVSYNLTPYLNGATNELIVRVYSPQDNGSQPRGKQTLYPGGIMYTSSSGIWQSVWLEPVDSSGVQNLTIIPDVDNSQLRLKVNTYATVGVTVSVTVRDAGAVVNTVTGSPSTELDIPISNPKLWSPDSPFLYDLQVVVIHNAVTNDLVTSYFGMRKISISLVNGIPKIFLNNQFLFGMGPLDQGFWPDGIYTAPTDAALAYDIQEEKALGFNTVRKHIKVERQRWYYWADKLGIMVWQDMPSDNSYTGNPNPPAVDPLDYIAELTAMVTNHWNSPAIIMWDIFNESQGQENTSGGLGQTNTAYLVSLVKTLDPSRLVNQASGGSYHGVGDVLDNHNYPDPGNPASTAQGPVDGEFGGIAWHVPGHLWNPAQAGNGYLLASSTANIATLYDGYIDEAVSYKSAANGGLNAAIYTQITDVENECNGLMTYDRLLKPDLNSIKISNQKAITGQLFMTTVLPTSQTQGRTWSYITSNVNNAVPGNWYATNFNASSWSSGPAGFGTVGTPGAVVRTTWNNSNIWLRAQFTLGKLSASDLNSLVFNCYHDEDCEIYLNGVLAGSAVGYAGSYVLLPRNTAGMNALIPNGNNLIAVHCHNTTGGQGIDVGISKKNLVANTLTVPADETGYWPLDATSGTVAVDATGNGNNGTVIGGTWNANGQINGCLNFNGLNNSVQISNTISHDFSIAFWVKTTQAGGTGQWYYGVGLVDGDVSFISNDFGTAMSGGKFAFGVGNPDTTILSTNAINDGAWHLCVATRVQATGSMSVYVDGNLQATETGGTNSLTASATLQFGQISSGGGNFSGSLDDIEIFNRALGNNEITALYNNSAFPPTAPTNLTATLSSARVTVSWNKPLWASGYTVSRSITSGGPYTPVGSLAQSSFTDTNVVNGSTYYYVVLATNSFGASTNSVEIIATPYTLACWFKADAIAGLANGASVSVWTDMSGNSNNATQSFASETPSYVTGAMNGLPVVRFKAASANYMTFNRPVQDDFTIICVFQSTQGYGLGNLYYQGAGLVNGEVSGTMNDFGTCLFTNGSVCAGTGNPDVAIDSAPGYNDGHPHILTFTRTEGAGMVSLYLDGSLIGTTVGGTQSLAAPSQLVLGAQQTLINYLNGDIAEVKIFNTVLSNIDRIAEENALKCKYGLSGGVAPAIPTGLAGTAGNRQITLNWMPTTGATSYNLWRSTNNGATYQPAVTGLAAASFIDTNAISERTNYYVVAAMVGCGMSANSPVVSVFLPLSRPDLILNVNGNALTINWPDWATDWMLYSATNLVPPMLWFPVTNEVGSNNGMFNVIVPINSGEQFFRLNRP